MGNTPQRSDPDFPADAQLALGVELECNDKTPQYQQALKVAMLNKERNEKTAHSLRDVWLKPKM